MNASVNQFQEMPSQNNPIFDINVNNYEIKDLEKMLHLQQPYDKKKIDAKCEDVRVKVITHHNGTQPELEQMLGFFSQAKEKLIEDMESNFMKQSSAPIMENNSHDIIDRRRHTQDKQDELSFNKYCIFNYKKSIYK